MTDSDEEVVDQAELDARSAASWRTMSASSARPSGWNARAHRIDMLTHEVEDYYGHFRVTHRPHRAAQPACKCADLIVRSALHRKESRGLHYTLDYPDLRPQAVDTVLVP